MALPFIPGLPKLHNPQEEFHVALHFIPGLPKFHQLQEDLSLVVMFVPQDLSLHHSKAEVLREPHLEVLEVLQNEGQRHHHRHLEGLLQVLYILENLQAHHLKASQKVLLDAL